MTNGHAPLSAGDFIRRLPQGFSPCSLDGVREIVFARPLRQDRRQPPELYVVVFSTLEQVGGQARDCGEDAIRVGLVHNPTGTVVMMLPRINRVGSAGAILDRVLERIRDLMRRVRDDVCPLCGAPLLDVVAKNPKGGTKRFVGCSGFRPTGCRFSQANPSGSGRTHLPT